MRAVSILVILLLATTLGSFGCSSKKDEEKPTAPSVETAEKKTPPAPGTVPMK